MSDFGDFLEVLSDDVFDEKPVPLNEFLYAEDYLNLPPLSANQTKMVEALTQIYNKDTLEYLWGPEEAARLWQTTFKEVILMWGKGSGKDYCSTIAFARIAYLLLCLRDPARYFGKPSGDSIHLLNVAINAKQANNVFFKGFLQRIKSCRWFDGKYKDLADNIQFDKNITAHSGHSEREAWEGYNLLVCVLDEIAGFASESEMTGTQTGRGKSADAIYNMYKASVSSRFPKQGKLALLSFSRFKGDFIQQRYAEVIAEKHTEIRTHQFKLHDELPDGVEHNEFEISWDEDHIDSYLEPNVWASRRPTWEINPLMDIDDLKSDFYRNPQDSLTRFACMPPDAVDAMFKDKEKVKKAFPSHIPPPFHDDWAFKSRFVPVTGAEYYLHVDLGYSHDRAAVAMSHVSEWVQVNYGQGFKHYEPMVVIDAVRYWTPRSDQNVDFNDIEEYIISLKRRGFDLKLVTFDRWSSVGFRQRLERDYNIDTDLLSVAKPHYEDFAVAMQESRVVGYDLPLAVEEILGLKIIKGNKVDHTSKGSKDVSDALAGAVYNSIKHTHRDTNEMVDVRFLDQSSPSLTNKHNEPPPKRTKANQPMPRELKDVLAGWNII